MRRSPPRRQVQRFLLVLLTVTASFGFLTRVQSPGGLGMTMPGPASHAAMSGPGAAVHARSGQFTPAPADVASAGHALSLTGAVPKGTVLLKSTVLLKGTAFPKETVFLKGTEPNAPPASTHDRAAHCLFCFTAAFALEAHGSAAPPAAGHWPWRAVQRDVRVHGLAIRHVNARAPPTLA